VWGCFVMRDLSYIERRARQERKAANEANCARVRAIHVDLARRYEEVLRAYWRDRAANLGATNDDRGSIPSEPDASRSVGR